MTHDHGSLCTHDLVVCERCDAVYCRRCHAEWKNCHQVHSGYYVPLNTWTILDSGPMTTTAQANAVSQSVPHEHT